MQITTLYETVTNRIIAELEQGAAPWLKPWKTGGSNASLVPANAMTGRTYSGINIPILWDAADRQGFPTQSWLTFRQAQERGGRVQTGAKGTHVVFTKRLSVEKEEDEEGESRSTRSMLRAYTVFNVAQVTGLPRELTEPEALPPPAVRLDRAWQFIYGTPADIRHGGDRAFYHPRLDFIQMPPFGAFLNPESFYATALHELGHNAERRIMPHGQGGRSARGRSAGQRLGIIRAPPGTRAAYPRGGTGPELRSAQPCG